MVNKIKNLLVLQGVIVIYTISGVMSKLASANKEDILGFIFFFGMEFVILALYAVLWQQIIKRFELSVAYASRSMSVLWSMVWAVVFFHDNITINNIIGVIMVVAGNLVINMDTKEREND